MQVLLLACGIIRGASIGAVLGILLGPVGFSVIGGIVGGP